MKHLSSIILLLLCSAFPASAIGDAALDSLMNRLSPGMHRRISVALTPGPSDFFTLSSLDGRPHITANNRVSAAVGLNHYLRSYLLRQPSWDCMSVTLPDSLPLPQEPLTRSTDRHLRYYLNYCTHSYSMPFWDESRWQREIDWMALHGINAALAITGSDAVWDATLRRLRYPEERIDSFIAAPAYQAWWLMNNLEGEGAPSTPAQLHRSVRLQRHIIKAMRSLDIDPVLPGYSGMVPHDAASTLGLDVADPGLWCGYNRPAFLLPTDTAFARVARIYYEEQSRLFGHATYYSMDPFHEGGNTAGVDLAAAARAIEKAMLQASPSAVWLIQGWQENPRAEILDAVAPSRLTVLNLHAESAPQWIARGHRQHPWVWCMLLNFGGNVGLHGKLDHVAASYRAASGSPHPPCGVGLTMEGIENNPVMFSLACDLPWLPDSLAASPQLWLGHYLRARYSAAVLPPQIAQAWQLLASSIYNAPADNRQQGTTESLFCARPSDHPVNASTWANARPYYDPRQIIRAAAMLTTVTDSAITRNPHFLYDLIDITRQAVAEAGRIEAARFSDAASRADSADYRTSASRFLNLIMLQDSLLATMPHFRLGSWTEAARRAATTPDLLPLMERDARTLISTWGSRNASETGQLHDYAHREWQGLLADLYYPRWKRWFAGRLAAWGAPAPPSIDFYAMDHEWIRSPRRYSPEPSGHPLAAARRAVARLAPYISK